MRTNGADTIGHCGGEVNKVSVCEDNVKAQTDCEINQAGTINAQRW